MLKLSSLFGVYGASAVSVLALLTAGCSSSAGGDATGGGPSTGGNTVGGGSAGQTAGGQTSGGGNTTAGNAGSGGAGAGGQSQGGGGMGAGGMSGAAGAGMAGAGGSAPNTRTGMSAGCNKLPPAMDSTSKYVLHEVQVNGLDPVYLKNGMYYQNDGKYDFSLRPYGVRLPANYDPSKAYAVTFGGGGCGGSATNFAGNPGGGLQIAGNGATIQVGLSYINGCFNDGGPSIGNRADTPEEPYFRAAFAEIAANYCVDLSQVFVSGYSSGAWEAYTLGCAASDIIRGISTDEGGLRTMHPTCKAPAAAVLVAGTADTENPIGPLDPNNQQDKGAIDRLGSFGSAPGRDEILKRNGCTGTATMAYEDPKFGQCMRYTGCPAAYPVLWCALPGVGHNNSTYNGQNYTDSNGVMWNVLGKLPAP